MKILSIKEKTSITSEELETINDYEDQEWEDLMDDSRFEPLVYGKF